MKRFIAGLSESVLIAGTLSVTTDKIFAQPVEAFDAATAWTGAIANAFQIMFYFSGYAGMAIGTALIFGYKIPENFNYPCLSLSMTEFWKRWNMSLISRIKEYLSFPSDNVYKTTIVFLLIGLWYGIGKTFAAWGLMQAALTVTEKAFGYDVPARSVFVRFLQRLYVAGVLIFGFIVFKAPDLGYAVDYIKNMFGLLRFHSIAFERFYYTDERTAFALIAAVLFGTPLFKLLAEKHKNSRCFTVLSQILLLVLFALSIAVIHGF